MSRSSSKLEESRTAVAMRRNPDPVAQSGGAELVEASAPAPVFMASILSEDHFHNEDAAYDYVEARLWPDGPVCPHCGVIKGNVGKLQGKSTRIGLFKCYVCRKQFTVKVGTIFESSHLPLRMWLQAIHLLCASKKGISTRRLQRMLRVARKTAWHLGHRIREAMGDGSLAPTGGARATAEVDEFHRSQGWIAVGTPIVGRAPHRTGRARLRHPAPTLDV